MSVVPVPSPSLKGNLSETFSPLLLICREDEREHEDVALHQGEGHGMLTLGKSSTMRPKSETLIILGLKSLM
jgi:hypothetical protein